MNALDIVRYGHMTFLAALDGCDIDDVTRPGACGSWSIKDIVAHLASYELVLVDVLDEVAGRNPGPLLDEFGSLGAEFNDVHVLRRQDRGFDDVLDELQVAHEAVNVRLAQFTSDQLRTPGIIPWYGAGYALDDMIVYMYYGHKREHAAQVAAFRDAGGSGSGQEPDPAVEGRHGQISIDPTVSHGGGKRSGLE